MKYLLILLFVLCAGSASAQDVIVKKDGSTVVCRVVEVTVNEIIYKKWSDLNGSNYVMDKSLTSGINYENGKKDTFGETHSQYLPNNQNDGTQQYNDRALLEMDAKVNNLKNDLQKRKVRNVLRWTGGIVLAIAGLGAIADPPSDENSSKNETIISGIICEGAGIWLITSAISHQKKIKELKSQMNSTAMYSYVIPFSNGTSLSINADLLSDRNVGDKTLGFGLRYNF